MDNRDWVSVYMMLGFRGYKWKIGLVRCDDRKSRIKSRTRNQVNEEEEWNTCVAQLVRA